jgi:hypothetical protein
MVINGDDASMESLAAGAVMVAVPAEKVVERVITCPA